MAWTAPMTAVANSVFTAAQFNTHVRDNFGETAPAKATAATQHFVATGVNAIAARQTTETLTSATSTTTSTSYTDLSGGAAPVVSGLTTGIKAIVWVVCAVSNSTGAQSMMSFAVSGATTLAAADTRCYAGTMTAGATMIGAWIGLVDLTAGSNTFTAKYRVLAGTGSYNDRRLGVFPL